MRDLGAQHCFLYTCGRMVSVVFSDKVGSVHVCWVYPFVIAVREALPLDQILEPSCASDAAMAEDPLYLLLFFPVHDIRWWSGVVRPMRRGLMVGG